MEKTQQKPPWFSIKEAAEYLDIGEPTIYRWMREGQITYRKVGDSTRFWQEDLDAVADPNNPILRGTARASYRIYYRPAVVGITSC